MVKKQNKEKVKLEDCLLKKNIRLVLAKGQTKSGYLGKILEVSWPFSKLFLYSNSLVINVFGKEYKLLFQDITSIKKHFFGIKITHKSKTVPKYVWVSGLFCGSLLYIKIKKINKLNGLNLPINMKIKK
jgi:hypothetical protein